MLVLFFLVLKQLLIPHFVVPDSTMHALLLVETIETVGVVTTETVRLEFFIELSNPIFFGWLYLEVTRYMKL